MLFTVKLNVILQFQTKICFIVDVEVPKLYFTSKIVFIHSIHQFTWGVQLLRELYLTNEIPTVGLEP